MVEKPAISKRPKSATDICHGRYSITLDILMAKRRVSNPAAFRWSGAVARHYGMPESGAVTTYRNLSHCLSLLALPCRSPNYHLDCPYLVVASLTAPRIASVDCMSSLCIPWPYHRLDSSEIEYLPISSVEKAKPIIEEFVEIWREVLSKKSLHGQFMRAEPNFAEYGLADNYTWQHTAVQYAAALAQLIASVQSRN
ncbi:mediator of RNA polymerase II transcription subunit 20a-like protein [Trifolium pratense]|uniref:Mediator of RNA polymerase II transcription subunit 20 n=1 Tax=Trifolium pratense TaxID=57577 RepID=A0A2K3PKW7_TRIPR|nr:mediator of RNA polymerase II transcription subunit 20a-like protein [Trifolium pratense]